MVQQAQQQVLRQAGVPIPGVQAALAVDALINRIDSPVVTALAAPVFLGTAAFSAAADVASDIAGVFGEHDAAWFAANNAAIVREAAQQRLPTVYSTGGAARGTHLA